ncbi:MAG TPA: tryptophan synthase subunit alpha [Actinomycetota bacterium]|nr:tryptophan synthase subunit alpha [Actinomycetota bacterium]
MGELEVAMRGVRDDGRRAFVPYVTGGYPGVDAGLLRTLADAGADAIEVGIPHSDPIMDGGVVQEASRVALERGTHPSDVLATIAEADLPVPVAVMTYANIVTHPGIETFCGELADAGVRGVIVPDLPVDESGDLAGATMEHAIDMVLLAAPGTAPERYTAIGAASHGFVYCVATYGVTGARDTLAATAREVVEAMRPHTDVPLLVGVGIATPELAREACAFADGVIVGSAMMAPLLDGDRAGVGTLAAAFSDAVRTS